MDPNLHKDPPEEGAPPSGANEAPHVLDIFRHAWPVMWERRFPMILFILALAVLETLSDRAVSKLMEPFEPALEGFMTKGPEDPAAAAALSASLEANGAMRLLAGAALPFLLMPFVSFALCRAALSQWDGYAPQASDLAFTLASYLKSLVVFIAVSVYGLALGILSTVFLLPSWALAKANSPGMGAIALIFGVFLWIRLLWPAVRRYFFLQIFVYFRMSDHPGLGGLLRETFGIERSLKAWPSHLNALCGLTLAVLLGIFIAVESVSAMIPAVTPAEPGLILSNAVYLLAFMWPVTAAAGFYRLCLRPSEEVSLPGLQPESEGGAVQEAGAAGQGQTPNGTAGSGQEPGGTDYGQEPGGSGSGQDTGAPGYDQEPGLSDPGDGPGHGSPDAPPAGHAAAPEQESESKPDPENSGRGPGA
ncbi:MAG: hypothetical protein LBW85_00800 [Deltaproteobacteria bacterium]|jgi:hypothetical protein|nr:hypothetical protein [Deltaproteobacteria bacterium]